MTPQTAQAASDATRAAAARKAPGKPAEPPETNAVPESFLPTEKSSAKIGLGSLKMLLFGPPKVGKSTFASELANEHTLFLDTEGGLQAIDAFKLRIADWPTFIHAIEELRKSDKFRLIVVDTVDTLARVCADHVLQGLSGGVRNTFVHASDFDYGKGWDAIAEEFRVRIGQLAGLDRGVILISHTKESMVTLPNGLQQLKLAPDVGQRGMRKWLLGFVDLIGYAHIRHTESGEQRVLQLQPSETIEAGGRTPRDHALPEAIPLEGKQFNAVLKAASGGA